MASATLEAAHRFLAAGRYAEAEEMLAGVLADKPAHVEALRALAVAASGLGRPDRCFDILSRAAAIDPFDAAVVRDLGEAHLALGRMRDATFCFERALAMRPDDAELRLALAHTHAAAGDLAKAEELAASLSADFPDHAGALALTGYLHREAGRAELAEQAFRAALSHDAFHLDSLRALAACRLEAGDATETLSLLERARLLAPLDDGVAEQNAICLAALGRLAEAEDLCARLLATAPRTLSARLLRARILIAQGRLDEAARDAGEAHSLAPDEPDVRALLREIRLRTGRSLARAEPAVPSARIVIPPGTSSAEIVLLARYLPLLRRKVGPVRVAGDLFWHPLLSQLGAHMALGGSPPDEESRDWAELPEMLGADPGSCPPPPYLAASADLRSAWRRAYDEHPGAMIGVVWAEDGVGPDMEDFRRVLPEGVTPVSLTVGDGRARLAAWPEALDAGLHLEGGLPHVIAAIAELDLVVGVDSLPLHLAGALGVPAFLVAPEPGPWYLGEREGRAIWYPTMTILRGDRLGGWGPALDTLRARLSKAAPGRLPAG